MEYFGAMYGKFTLKRLQRNGKIKFRINFLTTWTIFVHFYASSLE